MEDYEAMVPFQALQAYGVAVDAVCPGEKAGDICGTAVHDSSGHQDYEDTVPFQALQPLGCHVDAVCPKKKAGESCVTAVHDFEGDQTCSEKPDHNFTLTADFEGLDALSYDALVIPGGRAPEYLALDKTVIAIAKHFMEAKKPVASMSWTADFSSCRGPTARGKKCAACPAVKLNVVLAGAIWLEPDPIHRCFTHESIETGAVGQGTHSLFLS